MPHRAKRKGLLLTGATGFVGSHLARAFLDDYDLHVVARPQSRFERLADVLGWITVHPCDLSDREHVIAVVRETQPSVVVNAAAYGTGPGQTDNRQMVATNLTAVMNLVEACRDAPVECFIHTGSASEYGSKSRAMREDDLLEPSTEYGVTKAAATLYCQQATRTLHVPITTLRLFTPFGPHEAEHRLVPTLIRAAISGRSAELGSPDSVRDFVFVEDVVEAYRRIVVRPRPGGVLNVCSGQQASVREVVEALRSVCPGMPDPVYRAREDRRPEPAHFAGDGRALRALTGWRPRYSLGEGLTKTLAWWRRGQ